MRMAILSLIERKKNERLVLLYLFSTKIKPKATWRCAKSEAFLPEVGREHRSERKQNGFLARKVKQPFR
jgi:hypothetical protein